MNPDLTTSDRRQSELAAITTPLPNHAARAFTAYLLGSLMVTVTDEQWAAALDIARMCAEDDPRKSVREAVAS